MKQILLIFSFILIAAGSGVAQDSAPKLVNYQGRLTNASGQPMADGSYKLRFSLYNTKDASQPGDTLVWGADYTVTVVGGQFNVVLGASGGVSATGAAVNDIGFAFTDPARYLQITVLTDNTGTLLTTPQALSPRQQIMASP